MAISPLEVMGNPPPTPPHHPTYGVHMSQDEIKQLINIALDGSHGQIQEISQLPSGKSFNNRIYFVSFASNSTAEHVSSATQMVNDVVLKLPGWNFDVRKIENEVACHFLLEKYCPEIPVPRVVAWCEGDGKIRRVERQGDASREIQTTSHDARVRITIQEDPHSSNHTQQRKENPITPIDDSTSSHISSENHTVDTHSSSNPYDRLWILITRLPGQPIDPTRLPSQNLNQFTHQLAQYMTQWRRIPPPSPGGIGNLRILPDNPPPPPPSSSSSPRPYSMVFGLPMTISGLLIGSAPDPLPTPRSYFAGKLQGELEHLQSNPNYTANRSTVEPLVSDLLLTIFPRLVLFQEKDNNNNNNERSVFTHYDLSPRNILVSQSPRPQTTTTAADSSLPSPLSTPSTMTTENSAVTITGILDLEFAGFFPRTEEFTNTVINDPTAWPAPLWTSFLRHLRNQSIRVDDEDESDFIPTFDGKNNNNGNDEKNNDDKKNREKWEQACALVHIVENVAPWQVRNGGFVGEELDGMLREAREVVEGNVRVLRDMVGLALRDGR